MKVLEVVLERFQLNDHTIGWPHHIIIDSELTGN